jgi:hypothetical protein
VAHRSRGRKDPCCPLSTQSRGQQTREVRREPERVPCFCEPMLWGSRAQVLQRQAHSWSEARSTRQLALMHSLVRFCYLAAEGTFTTRNLYPQTLQAIRLSPEEYKLASLRYDLWKLRAKGLVEKIPHSRRYRLLPHGCQICLVFLYEKIYAPLTAGILRPFAADQHIPQEKITALIAATLPSSTPSMISSTPSASRPPEKQPHSKNKILALDPISV